MEGLANKLYIGIDLSEEYAMLSYYYPGLDKPNTVSFIAGSNDYRMPLVIAKRNGIGNWVYGNEAIRLAKEKKGTLVDSLYDRALAGENIEIEGKSYQAKDLLVLYMRKIITLPNKLEYQRQVGKLVFAVREINDTVLGLFAEIRESMQIEQDILEIIDYKECFYFYSCNQPEAGQNHEVALYDGAYGQMRYMLLSKNWQTKPCLVNIEDGILGSLPLSGRDTAFEEMLKKTLAKHMVTTIFFVGDTFDGDWMKESLQYACRGRRTYAGKNLYAMGACYASYQKQHKDWPFIYLGESEFKMNISLKVKNCSELAFYPLLVAGSCWYRGQHTCDVILDNTNMIELWLQRPQDRKAMIENLEIADLPARPNKTTRMRITAIPTSDRSAQIELEDLGFGELFESSHKVWRYHMEF